MLYFHLLLRHLVYLLLGTKPILAIKIAIATIIIFVTLGILIYIFSKNLLANVLEGLNCFKRYNTKLNLNGYKSRMFLQFLPLVLLMGTFIYLVSDTIAIREKGDILFNRYYDDLCNADIKSASSIEELKEKLNTIKKEFKTDTYFIIKPNEIIYQDTDFLII